MDFVLTFYHCDEIPEVNQLTGAKVYVGLWGQRFQFLAAWLFRFRDHGEAQLARRGGAGSLVTIQ